MLADPLVHSLADRVKVVHDPALDAGYPEGRPAVVTVTMTDGQVRAARADRPRGDGPAALADQAVTSKPRQLLVAAVGAAEADSLLEAVEGLGKSGIAPLSDAIRRLRFAGPSRC